MQISRIFVKFGQTIPRIITNKTVSGYLKYFFPWRPFTQCVSYIFSFFNFGLRYLGNQSEYQKSEDTVLLIDACWIRLCSHFAHAVAFDTRLIHENNSRSFHGLPAADTSQKKKSLKLYFSQKPHSLSFLLIYSFQFYWNWRTYKFFSWRAPAKVGSNLKEFESHHL